MDDNTRAPPHPHKKKAINGHFAGRATLCDLERRSKRCVEPAEAQWGFKEVNSEKGLSEHLDELVSTSYFHQGIGMNSAPCDWGERKEEEKNSQSSVPCFPKKKRWPHLGGFIILQRGGG